MCTRTCSTDVLTGHCGWVGSCLAACRCSHAHLTAWYTVVQPVTSEADQRCCWLMSNQLAANRVRLVRFQSVRLWHRCAHYLWFNPPLLLLLLLFHMYMYVHVNVRVAYVPLSPTIWTVMCSITAVVPDFAELLIMMLYYASMLI